MHHSLEYMNLFSQYMDNLVPDFSGISKTFNKAMDQENQAFTHLSVRIRKQIVTVYDEDSNLDTNHPPESYLGGSNCFYISNITAEEWNKALGEKNTLVVDVRFNFPRSRITLSETGTKVI